jgi:hypothetical protein
MKSYHKVEVYLLNLTYVPLSGTPNIRFIPVNTHCIYLVLSVACLIEFRQCMRFCSHLNYCVKYSISINTVSSPAFSKLCTVYRAWFSHLHFVLYRDLPTFLNSVILVPLVIFLCDVSSFMCTCLSFKQLFHPSLCLLTFRQCVSHSLFLRRVHELLLSASSYLSVS